MVLWGTRRSPPALSSSHVALCKASPAVDSTIDTTTDKALAFSGKADVTIAQGKEIGRSHRLRPACARQRDHHHGLRKCALERRRSLWLADDLVSPIGRRAQRGEHGLREDDGALVLHRGHRRHGRCSAKAVVAIGDSITDGRGTDTNKNNRWTELRPRACTPTPQPRRSRCSIRALVRPT